MASSPSPPRLNSLYGFGLSNLRKTTFSIYNVRDDIFDVNDERQHQPKVGIQNWFQKYWKKYYRIPFYIWLLWLTVGTIYYSIRDDFQWGLGFYMAVNVGYSIGWGYPLDPTKESEWFSVFYVWVGAGLTVYILGCLVDIVSKTSREWDLVIHENDNNNNNNNNNNKNNIDITSTNNHQDNTDKIGDRNDSVKNTTHIGSTHSIDLPQYHYPTTTSTTNTSSYINHKKWCSNIYHKLINYCSSSNRKMVYKKCQKYYNSHYTAIFFILLYIFWIFIMQMWATFSITNWTFIDGLYFAVASCSTGGLWAIPNNSPEWDFVIAGILTCLGVPIMGIAFACGISLVFNIGSKQSILSDTINNKVTESELALLDRCGISNQDGYLDKSEYILLCAIRLNTMTPEMIEYIVSRFDKLDSDKKGRICYANAFKRYHNIIPQLISEKMKESIHTHTQPHPHESDVITNQTHSHSQTDHSLISDNMNNLSHDKIMYMNKESKEEDEEEHKRHVGNTEDTIILTNNISDSDIIHIPHHHDHIQLNHLGHTDDTIILTNSISDSDIIHIPYHHDHIQLNHLGNTDVTNLHENKSDHV